jgi:hypothetical protein
MSFLYVEETGFEHLCVTHTKPPSPQPYKCATQPTMLVVPRLATKRKHRG